MRQITGSTTAAGLVRRFWKLPAAEMMMVDSYDCIETIHWQRNKAIDKLNGGEALNYKNYCSRGATRRPSSQKLGYGCFKSLNKCLAMTKNAVLDEQLLVQWEDGIIFDKFTIADSYYQQSGNCQLEEEASVFKQK